MSSSSKDKYKTDKNEKKTVSVSLGGIPYPVLISLFAVFIMLIVAVLYFALPSLRDNTPQNLVESSVTSSSEVNDEKEIVGNSAISKNNLLRTDTKKTAQLPIELQKPPSSDPVTLRTLLNQIKVLEKSIELANANRIDATDLIQIKSNIKRVDELEEQFSKVSRGSSEIFKNNQSENVSLYGRKQFAEVGHVDDLENTFRELILQDQERRKQELEKIREGLDSLVEKHKGLEEVLILQEQVSIRQKEAMILTIEISKLSRKASTALPFRQEVEMIEFINPFKEAVDHEFNKAIETLGSYSLDGVATISDLSASFDNMAHQVIKSDVLSEDDGWVDATIGKLRQIVTVRRVGGNIDPESIEGKLGEARVLLSAGYLNLVAEIFDTIPDKARRGADGWLTAIRARVEIDKALEVLEREALNLVMMTQSLDLHKEHD